MSILNKHVCHGVQVYAVASELGRALVLWKATDDDGSPYKVKVQRQGDGMLVEVNARKNWRRQYFAIEPMESAILTGKFCIRSSAAYYL